MRSLCLSRLLHPKVLIRVRALHPRVLLRVRVAEWLVSFLPSLCRASLPRSDPWVSDRDLLTPRAPCRRKCQVSGLFRRRPTVRVPLLRVRDATVALHLRVHRAPNPLLKLVSFVVCGTDLRCSALPRTLHLSSAAPSRLLDSRWRSALLRGARHPRCVARPDLAMVADPGGVEHRFEPLP